MPINPALLIAAPMLQDQLVDDQTGLPLIDGSITMYQDNSRTTFKNWYYQSGSPGAYTYITLPNPLTLSAAGTIVDNNGNDTIPFYYPYDETDSAIFQPYYVVVKDQFGAQKFTRQNFPFVTAEDTPVSTDVTFTNYAINGEFWRNIGSTNATTIANTPQSTFVINGITYFYVTVVPSQHDGLSMPDIIFAKNANGAADTITFQQFPLGSEALNSQGNGITPQYYFNLNCTGAGSETSKFLQIPIALGVQNLTNVNATITFWAQDVTNVNNQLAVTLLEYLGTGVLSPVLNPLRTIALTNGWTQYIIPFTFPDIAGETIASSAGGPNDDAWYLQFNFPAGTTCNINIALPAIYLGNFVPSNDFQNYDQINAIISSPRTGDLRISLNSFQPFGWVAANDGTIGSPGVSGSIATTRANSDVFQLYNLIWQLGKSYDTGSNFNAIAQIYTGGVSPVATNYGSTAIGDFNANKALALTRAFGRVLLGTAPTSTLLTPQSTTYTASSSTGLLITTANAVNFFNGMPIVFTNTGGAIPTGLVANAVYYVSGFNGTTAFKVSTTFANAMAGTVIAFTNAGSGTNTVTSAVTGSSEGEYAHTQLVAELAAHNHTSLPGGVGAGFDIRVADGSGDGNIPAGNQNRNDSTTNTTGSSTPFNVTQPGTFYNIYFKL